MKRTRLRSVSKKTARRKREVAAWKRAFLKEIGRCELCRRTAAEVLRHWIPRDRHPLEVNEIARGACRQLAENERYAILGLCWKCHEFHIHGGVSGPEWPEPRQLALLRLRRQGDFDLIAYNTLKGRGPNRITLDDVRKYDE